LHVEALTRGEPQFQVTLGDFSGPLDLLCHLVESNTIDASSVKLTDLLSQYVSYLLGANRATLAELAEFFSLASRILIRKVRSLMPKDGSDMADEEPPDDPDASGAIVPDGEADEAELRAMLERFRPYRSAALRLMEMKASRERSSVRISDEGGPPWFDIGDLYGLATLWWSLIEERRRARSAASERGFLAEIPDAAPEEVLVERRMDEVDEVLRESGGASLRALLERFGPGGLIVTLLALLELSRLGRLRITQAEPWGDVAIGRGVSQVEVRSVDETA
jgi:segregation and condensation protein A